MGRVLCSGELYHLSSIDLDDLRQEYHLRAIIDLRTPKEVTHKPDDVIEGVSYVNYPLLDVDSNFLFDELTLLEQIGSLEGDPRDYIASQYKAMIKDPYTVGELARVIETFRKYEEGAILWHSNLGKDRTSLVTAILLEILGVPRSAILKDFQKSNLYLAMEKEYALEFMVANGFDRENTRPKVNALFEVEQRYLEGVFQAIDEEYGSMQRFLRKALYLTPKSIEDLKEMYLI